MLRSKGTGVDVEAKDISLAGRIIANFPENLTEAQRISEDRKPPKLQQWVVVNEWKNEGEWADIPIEYEVHNKQI